MTSLPPGKVSAPLEYFGACHFCWPDDYLGNATIGSSNIDRVVDFVSGTDRLDVWQSPASLRRTCSG